MDTNDDFTSVPVIDIHALVASKHNNAVSKHRTIREIGKACRRQGFFYISNHGVSRELQDELQRVTEIFFGMPHKQKCDMAMQKGGKAWRGYFAVGDEVTSGIPDQKEGIYFGVELPSSDPRPLHGANLWPKAIPEMRRVVLQYLEAMNCLARIVLKAIAASLGLDADHFGKQFKEPLALFRIFHYPPHDSKFGPLSHAVGEHTDYGYITILKQDDSGGLEVRNIGGEWVPAPPVPNTFVVNLGDALEHNTGGLYRATPHRVRQRVGAHKGRYSFPYFFDPTFESKMVSVVPHLSPALQEAARNVPRQARWDGRRPELFEGTYGDYVMAKVSKVFPELAKSTPAVGEAAAASEARQQQQQQTSKL